MQVFLKKIDKIIDDLPSRHRDMAERKDIYRLLEDIGIKQDDLSSKEERIIDDYLGNKFQIY